MALDDFMDAKDVCSSVEKLVFCSKSLNDSMEEIKDKIRDKIGNNDEDIEEYVSAFLILLLSLDEAKDIVSLADEIAPYGSLDNYIRRNYFRRLLFDDGTSVNFGNEIFNEKTGEFFTLGKISYRSDGYVELSDQDDEVRMVVRENQANNIRRFSITDLVEEVRDIFKDMNIDDEDMEEQIGLLGRSCYSLGEVSGRNSSGRIIL